MTTQLGTHPAVRAGIDLLTAWIDAQMAYRGQPGLSIAVVHDQEVVWARGFGFADVAQETTATPQTIYRIASISKLFTATAILQLRDAGHLQLDDPIAHHLPWFKVQSDYADAPPITIRHLLTHTSGLPREADFPYWSDSNFPTSDQMRAALPNQQAALPTATAWKYSNLAVALAGEIVDARSGQGWADYVTTHILHPLDMASTFAHTIDAEHPNLAVGYSRRLPNETRQVSPFTDCQGIAPAANMATTVMDLARFAMLQFRDGPSDGAQILRGATLREMQRVHWLEPDWTGGWGLGFRITRKKDKTLIGHGGAVMGYRTGVTICPADKVAIIVLTNADDGNPALYEEKAFTWVAPALVTATTPLASRPEPDPSWAQYVGKYRSAWRDSEVLLLDGVLTILDPHEPDPLLTQSTLTPVAAHTFRIHTANGSGMNGEPAIFEFDEAGKVTRLMTGVNYSERIEQW